MTRKINLLLISSMVFATISSINAQVSTPFNTGFPANYVGWNAAQLFPVTVSHKGNFPINFQTNGTQRMTIMNTTGFVGIGLNFTTPNNLLDVSGGDIDVNTATRGYMIGDNYVLWHNGNITNIFTGVNAGSAAVTGANNTFSGFNSGNATTNGIRNAFFGSQSGASNTSGSNNTYMGFRAGFAGNTNAARQNTCIGSFAGENNVNHSHTFIGFRAGFSQNSPVVIGNTFIGWNAGSSNFAGGENVFVGYQAGLNDQGSTNTFIGFNCGQFNTNGFNNSFLGQAAGVTNTTGNDNVFIGRAAGIGNTTGNSNTVLGSGANVAGNFNNMSAIGAGALAVAGNTMILGTNTVNVGIGLSGLVPNNKLEINQGTTGFSGLRFRTLTSSYNPGVNASKFLTVDINGDVILANLPGTGTLTNAQNGTSVVGTTVELGGNPLLHCTEVPMATNDMFFSGNGTPNADRLVVGKGCFSLPVGKLDVLQSSTGTNSTGVHVENTDDGTFNTSFSTMSIGLSSLASGSSLFSNAKIAGFFSAPVAPVLGQKAFAIVVPQEGGTVSIGWSSPQFSGNILEINGDAGKPVAGPWVGISDIRVKKDTSAFTDGLDVLKKIHPVFYKFNGKAGIDTAGRHIGVVAQQIQSVAPYTISTYQAKLDTGDLSLTTLFRFDGNALTYIAINAIKQLDSINTSLQDQITALQTIVNSCCSNNQKPMDHGNNSSTGNKNSSGALKVDLDNIEDIILYQNEPNPFGEQTSIRYYVPESSGSAQVIFYDEFGRSIKTIAITDKGNGKLDVNTANLASGIYSYSIVVNGIVKDTKRMVRNK